MQVAQAITPLPSNAPPTHARYMVIFFAITLAILAYIDRVAISQAAKRIQTDLGLNDQEIGWVFSAFGIAYALFEIPGGWLGDLWGPKKVLIRIVVCWSLFTALTGAAMGFMSMVLIRFAFGAGEAGCFPNLTKAFSVWLPLEERTKAQGVMWTFARWGGAFTPPLVILAFTYMDWRWAFVAFGLLGVFWCAAFAWWFKDNPKDHPSVNAAEMELLKDVAHLGGGHGDVPWKKLVASRSVRLLWIQYFCLSFPWYFYITFLPKYLQEHRNLSESQAANYAIFPLLFGGFGALLAGFLAPRVSKWVGSVSLGRRSLAVGGFLGASVFLIICIQLQDPLYAMIAMGMASFCNDLSMPGAWSSCMDIGGKYAGTVSGSMNMMGNLAGFAAPLVGGYILQNYNRDYNMFIYVMAGVYLIGASVWPFIDPVTPLEADDRPSPPAALKEEFDWGVKGKKR
ncbi:MAG: MFS transporter [Bryobacteraceae bacterium]